MARVKKNLLTKGLSGMIGGTLVFRNFGDETIVSASPVHDDNTPTLKQAAQRERFSQAVAYAITQMAIPDAKAQYALMAKRKSMPSAYSVAVADFFNAPIVKSVNLSAYTGAIGDTIRLVVIDDFDVLEVSLDIINPDGSILETGKATRTPDMGTWTYIATAQNVAVKGGKVVIRAVDRPGNITSQEQAM
ncbi:MAG TPA: hypothetical protein VIU12_01555 [Chryseolinea sp.]